MKSRFFFFFFNQCETILYQFQGPQRRLPLGTLSPTLQAGFLKDQIMKKGEALEFVGGLSSPSKMPGKAYGLPAWKCKTGSVLARVKGTVCAICYANNRGMYSFKGTKKAQARRLATIKKKGWIAAMVRAIAGEKWFRWHDSGDLQSVEHLTKIVAVCRLSPETKFWLPTRELRILRNFRALGGMWPENLVVRYSSVKIGDGPAATAASSVGVNCSTVDSEYGFQCPSSLQGNKCGDCRACWDKEIYSVSYRSH